MRTFYFLRERNRGFVFIALFFLTGVAMTTVAAGQFAALEILQGFDRLAQRTLFHSPGLEAGYVILDGRH
jgi:hypothetical protein